MQFMILFTRHPDKAATPTPTDLREVRGFSTDGLVQQVLRRRDGYLQSPMIVPLKPYSGFAPRS